LPRGLPWVAAIGLAIAIPASVSLFRNSETPDTLSASQLQNARRVTFSMEYESAPTWSPDGTRVAYQASDAGYLFVANHDIWVTQLGSGEPLNLTNSPTVNDRMPSWSPDGREIAFFSNQGGQWAVHIMPALGGSALSVLPLPSIVNSVWSVLRWSQDGTTLFVSVSESPNEASQNVVYVLPRSTLTPARVHLPDHDNYFCGDLSVRPDGGRFAYVQGTGGNSEVSRLWTTPSTGGKPVPLTDGFTNVRSPNWSKDGRTVFYVSNRGGSMDLWRQQVTDDGTPLGEPLPLTSGVGMQSATFSGDGTKLAYTRGGPVSNLWRVDLLADRPATWADARQLTSERAYIEFVDVDTRGEWLAFSSDRRGNQDLWRLRTSGGEMTPIRTDPTPDWNPRWSPDASQIAFYAFRSGHREIWVMPSRGGPAQQLTFDRGRNNGNPRWSPDGTEILFASWRSGRPGDWLMNAKGGEPRPLKRSGLQWLPDGSGFVDSEPNGTFSRVSKDGSQSVVLPSTGHERGGGSFQVARDGQSIYYVVISGPDENQHLWKMSLADGRISQLTKLDGKRGRLGNVFAADDRYLYVIWHEDEADIWVMDVVKDDGQRR
jgi:Tol biopolymer transport system component